MLSEAEAGWSLLFYFDRMESSGIPYTIVRYPVVDSTNRIAFELGEQGAEHGTVVIAGEQTGGKGRLSRRFASPTGGLYMSAIIKPRLPRQLLPLITLAAGIACVEAVESVSDVRVALKWPNDLYVDRKKLGGILTEAAPFTSSVEETPFVVVGVGLNVNTPYEIFPQSLQDRATSLYCLTGRKYLIDILLQSLVRTLLDKVLLLAENPEKIIEEWGKRDFLLGKQLCWQDPQGWVVRGTGSGILADGRYRLTTASGDEYPVLAGDIIITDVDGQHIK